MAAVLIKIGVKARDHGEPAPPREPQDAQPESRLGGDVDHVRPKRIDRPMDRPKRRPRQMKLLVERQDDRPDRMDVFSTAPRAVVGVDQLNVVAASVRTRTSSPRRPRNAVDLGKIGFGDQCDAHGLTWGDLETNLMRA